MNRLSGEPTKMTVIIGGQEICSKEDWNKVTLRQEELMRENERLRLALTSIFDAESPRDMYDIAIEALSNKT